MIKFLYGRMAELVDAPDSKSSSSNGVWVRFPLRPPSVFEKYTFCLRCVFNVI